MTKIGHDRSLDTKHSNSSFWSLGYLLIVTTVPRSPSVLRVPVPSVTTPLPVLGTLWLFSSLWGRWRTSNWSAPMGPLGLWVLSLPLKRRLVLDGVWNPTFVHFVTEVCQLKLFRVKFLFKKRTQTHNKPVLHLFVKGRVLFYIDKRRTLWTTTKLIGVNL